jgi:hypothetical protein
MSALDQDPFPFLDLPKDIRFMVYDLFPVVTRHHVITTLSRYNTDGCSLTIISYRIPGISLLATCRTINDEAIGMQRNTAALNRAPLRLSAHWQTLGGPALRAILPCASNQQCA